MTQSILHTSLPTNTPAGALFKYDNTSLHIPCAIIIDSLSESQIILLVANIQEKLSGKLFRDIELFLSSYRGLKKAVKQTDNFIYHIYLRLTFRSGGILRISTDNRPFGNEGGGVVIYELNQFEALLNHIKDDR